MPDGTRNGLLLASYFSIVVDSGGVLGLVQHWGIEPVVEAYAKLIVSILMIVVPRVSGKPGLEVTSRVEAVVELKLCRSPRQYCRDGWRVGGCRGSE